MFMSSSMKAAIHLGPNYLANSEICKNTKFKEITSLFNIIQKLVVEHSEEILTVKCLECSSPSWTRSVSSRDQAIRWAKEKESVKADSAPCVGQMKDSPGAIDRWKGQVEGLRLYSSYQDAVGIDGEAIEFQWKNFRIFIIVYSSEDPKKLGEKEHSARRVQGPDHLHANVQWHWVEKEWWELCFECRESQELRDEITARIWDIFWVLGHLVFKSISALSRGILKQMKGKNTTHFNADSMDTELWFQTTHSVQQFSNLRSSGELVSSIKFEKEEEGRVGIPLDNKILNKFIPKIQFLVSLPTIATRSRMRENVLSLEALASIQLTQLFEIAYFQYRVTADKQYKIRPDGDDGQGSITPPCREYTFSRSFPKSQVLASIPEGWASFGSSNCESSWWIWKRSCDSVNC